MYPILYQGTSFSVGSYATFMMLAILAGLGTLLWRSRRLSVNTDGRVVVLLLCGLLGGWLASRGLPVLLHAAGSTAGWRRLLPTEAAGQSGTAFLIGCLPAVLVLAFWKRRAVWVYVDAAAPSLLVALAVSKVGCLLAGCCYGQLCEGAWGVRYPFGSHAYVKQYGAGLVDCPTVLLRPDEKGPGRPWAHVARLRTWLEKPPAGLADRARQHGMSYAQLVGLAERQQSLPVWPIPVWYILVGLVGWAAAEWAAVRVARRPGLPAGVVLVWYGLIRLVFDGFLNEPSRKLGLTGSQWMAIVVAVFGVVLCVMAGRRAAAGEAGVGS